MAEEPRTFKSDIQSLLNYMRSGPSGFSPVAGGATSLPQPSPYAPAFKETFLGGAGAPSGFAPTTYGGFSGQEYGGQKGLGEYFEAPQVQSYSTPWMQQYANQMGYNTSDPLAFTPFGAQEQKQYLSTGQFDLGKLSESPITAPQAQNRAQAGKMQSTAMQDAMKAIQEATTRSGKLEKMEGFQREVGREYSPERDVAGNIIAMNALSRAGETLTPEELRAKSYRAAGSEGGAGNPFTPNLDKFKARQTAMSQIPSWEKAGSAFADKTPQEQAELRSLVRESTGGRQVVGKVTGAETTSGSGADVTKTRFTPSQITSNQADIASASAQQNKIMNPNQGGLAGQMTGQFKEPYSGSGNPSLNKRLQTEGNKMMEAYNKNPSAASAAVASMQKPEDKKKKQPTI